MAKDNQEDYIEDVKDNIFQHKEYNKENDQNALQFSLPLSLTINNTNSCENCSLTVSSVLREGVNCSTQNTSERTYGSILPSTIPKQCSNCRTITSSTWRRTINKQLACNACGLYYKQNGIHRPIEMWKDIIYPRNSYSKLIAPKSACFDENRLKKLTDKSNKCENCGTTSTYQWRQLPGINFGQNICKVCSLNLNENGGNRILEESNFNYEKSKKSRNEKCINCGVTKSTLWRRNQLRQIVCNACGLYYKLHLRNRPINMRRDFIAHRKRGAKICAINVVKQNLSINVALTDDETNSPNNNCNESIL